jgi:hypothetical protein
MDKQNMITYTDMRLYNARKGEDTYSNSYKIRYFLPHPKYVGPESCYDIALFYYDTEDCLGDLNYNLRKYSDP